MYINRSPIETVGSRTSTYHSREIVAIIPGVFFRTRREQGNTIIDEDGQAFADVIFRVYSLQHPEVRIVPANTGPEVKRAIKRAKTSGAVLPFNGLDH
jgi:hypothetical protein